MVYDVQISREPIRALFDIKGSKNEVRRLLTGIFDNLPKNKNTFVLQKAKTLMFVGSDHWILKADLEEEDQLKAVLNPDLVSSSISVVLVSDSLTFFSIEGYNAKDIMEISCPLDFHESSFTEDYVTFSEVFGVKALIKRIKNGFEFAVDQSFGDMINDYLNRTVKD